MFNEPPYTFAPDVEYPVALAEYHCFVNDVETPVSGDLINLTYEERKAKREAELDHWNQYNT